MVHEGGIVIESLDDGAVRFVRPNGQAFDSHPTNKATDWTAVRSAHVYRDSASTQWRGERMDFGLAVEVLLRKAGRNRRPSSLAPAIAKQ